MVGYAVGFVDGFGVGDIVGIGEGAELGVEVGGLGGPIPETRNVMVGPDSDIS
jgi:hypothetical protein